MGKRLICRVEHTEVLVGCINVSERTLVKAGVRAATAVSCAYTTNNATVRPVGRIASARSILIGDTAHGATGISVFVFIHLLFSFIFCDRLATAIDIIRFFVIFCHIMLDPREKI